MGHIEKCAKWSTFIKQSVLIMKVLKEEEEITVEEQTINKPTDTFLQCKEGMWAKASHRQ